MEHDTELPAGLGLDLEPGPWGFYRPRRVCLVPLQVACLPARLPESTHVRPFPPHTHTHARAQLMDRELLPSLRKLEVQCEQYHEYAVTSARHEALKRLCVAHNYMDTKR